MALEGVRGQRHAPAALYPRERPATHCTGGWVGPRACLDRCGKSPLYRDSIPGPSSPVAQSLYRLSYRAHMGKVIQIKMPHLFWFQKYVRFMLLAATQFIYETQASCTQKFSAIERS